MDRNTVLAIVLIALVFLLTPYYFELISPGSLESQENQNSKKLDSENLLDDEKDNLPVNPVNSRRLEAQETIVHVETNLYKAAISSANGGSITSFELKNHNKYDSTKVQLIGNHNSDNLLISFMSSDGESIALKKGWKKQNKIRNLSAFDSPQDISFKTNINGTPVNKTLTIYPDDYSIDIDVDLRSTRNMISQNVYTFSWNGGLPTTEKNVKDDRYYSQGSVHMGGEIHTPKLSAKKEKKEHHIGSADWAAVRSKYFISALIPSVKTEGSVIGGKIIDEHPVYNIGLISSADLNNRFTLYLGPLQKQRIEALGVGLEKTMNFGYWIIRPISKGVLWALVQLYKIIPNYGVVLIVFSIVVKLLTYPLTKKSYQSTREMQSIQPLIAKLKEKYKHDPKRMNQEQMKLFKEHGVNPLGGCLPMLLQMPLLIALFIVFRSTIELRGQPFILWVTDLSTPDTIAVIGGFPLNILPLLMGATMFIQMKMTQTPTTAQNKYMPYIMNGVFLVIFYQFPSGLNLYYALFNLFTILQQKYLTPAAPPVPA